MSDGWLGPLLELLAGTPLCGLGFLTMWWLSPKESGERERERQRRNPEEVILSFMT